MSEMVAEWTLPKPTPGPDQQKGRFGGKYKRNGRYLTAEVTSVSGDKDWYRVRLRVFPEPGQPPIEGKATFYLHQSFEEDEIRIKAKQGEATLTIYSYGAFTVGAVVDDGNTPLELDLAELTTAPKRFRER
jgi:hypothetical protein